MDCPHLFRDEKNKCYCGVQCEGPWRPFCAAESPTFRNYENKQKVYYCNLKEGHLPVREHSYSEQGVKVASWNSPDESEEALGEEP